MSDLFTLDTTSATPIESEFLYGLASHFATYPDLPQVNIARITDTLRYLHICGLSASVADVVVWAKSLGGHDLRILRCTKDEDGDDRVYLYARGEIGGVEVQPWAATPELLDTKLADEQTVSLDELLAAAR